MGTLKFTYYFDLTACTAKRELLKTDFNKKDYWSFSPFLNTAESSNPNRLIKSTIRFC